MVSFSEHAVISPFKLYIDHMCQYFSGETGVTIYETLVNHLLFTNDRKTYNCYGRLITVPEDLITAPEHLPIAPEHLLTAPEHFRNWSGVLS